MTLTTAWPPMQGDSWTGDRPSPPHRTTEQEFFNLQ